MRKKLWPLMLLLIVLISCMKRRLDEFPSGEAGWG